LSTLKIPIARVFEPLLAPARYKAALGGRGSGKSHFSANCWSKPAGPSAARAAEAEYA
jgi:hypothetical protein